MSITEVILVASLVVNIFTIALTFYTFVNVLNIKPQIQQIHVGLSTTLSKIFTIENILQRMGAGFTEFIKITENMMDYSSSSNGKIVYKTADGKYSAKTIDELIDKIKQDGTSNDYFNDEELDKLKKMFEGDDDDDDNSYDEDERD